MAHTICGIDLGTFSVKFVLLEVSFRATRLRGLMETSVPPGEAPLLERQARAVRAGLAEIAGEATPYVAIPGDQLSIRLLELPFTEARKIDQVVGYELEGQIVHALEDVVYDHVVVGSTDVSSTVLAVAAKRDDVGNIIATLEAEGAHPRALFAGPVVYRQLSRKAVEGADAGPCEAILDVGHARTNICIVRDGRVLAARTIMRGGLHLTNAIAQAFGSDQDRAEQAKRSEAHLITPARPARTPLETRLDGVLRDALAPLVRDIRQTLASFRATSKGVVDAILLTGGSGRLSGLPEFFEAELGTPTRILAVKELLEAPAANPAALSPVEGDDEVVVEEAIESSSYALAAALALAGSRGAKEIDLRRGPYVYRASFSILRQKAVHLAGLFAALIVAGGVDVGAALSNLGAERRELDKQLKTATQELFGQPRDDAEAVTQLLRKGFREELAPLPKATAFDLLDQMSRKMPSGEKIKLDVMELDIRPKKTFIKGTVDSASAVDDIAAKLKEVDCFEEVTKGAITEIAGGGKQFSLNMTSKCP
ncbi:MAG TPA: pilus assembly protein PilM [Polyangia bacterium]|jgi:general secretion pathway protein L|nr:pilus assembly protein PilM [Polyangia bacterium]